MELINSYSYFLAPVGCLQYYTDLTGTVSSFNYGTALNGNNIMSGTTLIAGTRQIANTNYGICVNMQPGYCSIQWAQSGDPESFTVTGDTAVAFALNGLPSGGLINGACTTDYVVIPNPFYVNATTVTTDRFCGNAFPTVVSKYIRIFYIIVQILYLICQWLSVHWIIFYSLLNTYYRRKHTRLSFLLVVSS